MSTTVSNPANTTAPSGRSTTTFESTLRSARSSLAFSEIFRQALDSFSASRTRFLLTMLGMVIGSASIVLVATVGSTGKQYVYDAISGLGPNKVEMQYSGGVVMGPNNISAPDFMTIDDMRYVDSQVPGIVASSPMLEVNDTISLRDGVTQAAMLLGVDPQYKQVRNLRVLAGRFFDEEDAMQHDKVAVIFKGLAIKLYGSYADAVGSTISMRGQPFTIIGVFEESMPTYDQSEIHDNTLLIPYGVARYFTGTNNLKEIFFKLERPEQVEPAAQDITDIISSRHRAGSLYKAATLTDILQTMSSVADMLTVVLLLASAITLVVSGVGIMNSMLANVQSRIKEIGIRKALGATSREIRMQFLTEAVFLSLSGGLIGTMIGLAVPLGVRLFTRISIPISPWSAVAALATSVLVGVVFGTLPAARAAKLDPVTTLKYE